MILDCSLLPTQTFTQQFSHVRIECVSPVTVIRGRKIYSEYTSCISSHNLDISGTNNNAKIISDPNNVAKLNEKSIDIVQLKDTDRDNNTKNHTNNPDQMKYVSSIYRSNLSTLSI